MSNSSTRLAFKGCGSFDRDGLTGMNSKEELTKYEGLTSKIGECQVFDPFKKIEPINSKYQTGEIIVMKYCSRCKTEHPKSEFYTDKRSSDGLTSWCKTSQKIYTKQLQKAKRSGGAPYSTKRFEV